MKPEEDYFDENQKELTRKRFTQETIDSVALNLITELAGDWVYEKPGEATTQDCAYLTLLEIRGICQMAEALSEVLQE